jgi:uncharacterized protein (DUF58 family)
MPASPTLPIRPTTTDRARAAELAALLAEVRRIEVHGRRLAAGVMAGGYRSVFRGVGIEFDEVREYVEGDDPRSVDWNVTARVGRPFVRKYVDERERTLLFLFDHSASMAAGLSAWSARTAATRVVACLALSAVRSHDKTGLIAFSHGATQIVPPRTGAGHALRIVRDCLALPTTEGASALAPALELATRVVRRGAIVFVLSDFLGAGWREPLARCARRHDVVAVRLLVPELVAPPAGGVLRVRDPESGAVALADFSSARVREAWSQRIAAWRRRTEEELARARVDHLDVRVDRRPDRETIVRPILDFFRMRELRGAKR